jgi:hypothetical protein
MGPLDEQHVRTLNERFASAADKLGTDKPAPVRLAGVYAMAGLADDWEDNRQTCIDVLCGYLRMPYAPDPGEGDKTGHLAFLGDREVRHTIIRVIAAHLRDGARVSWQGRKFDFTGVIFDGGGFSGAVFSGGLVSFVGARRRTSSADRKKDLTGKGRLDWLPAARKYRAEFGGALAHQQRGLAPAPELQHERLLAGVHLAHLCDQELEYRRVVGQRPPGAAHCFCEPARSPPLEKH